MLTIFTMLFGQTPYWRHHCILLFFSSFIFLISYFFVYRVNQTEFTTYVQAYRMLESKIKRLTQHISQQQPSKIELCRELASISSQPISAQHADLNTQLIELVGKTELSLDQIEPLVREEQAGWRLKLSGDYHQFLHFLDDLVQSFLPLSIDYVEAQSDADRLVFVLHLILE